MGHDTICCLIPVKLELLDRLIYPEYYHTVDGATLLMNKRKVEDGLGTLLQELFGVDTRVKDFEDITVGWETQIIAFRLQPRDGKALDLVIRIYSTGAGWKAEREFNVMRRLGAVGYPVPIVYVYDASGETLGSPFIIMERITGGTLWDVFFASPRDRYDEVLALNARLMAQLHEIPPTKVLSRVRRLRTRSRILERVQDESRELNEHGLKAVFDPLINWLIENSKSLSKSPACLIHQDLHPRNILLRPDGSPVVIDWASCTVGDFREDLCWTALLAGTFIDAYLKKTVYNSYGSVSARELVDLPYFEAYSGLRRLADAALTMKVGATSRGMRSEALNEIEKNRPHYSKVLSNVVEATGASMPGLDRVLGV